MKKEGKLSLRQEELLNFLWEVNEPLTANQMAERLQSDGWNSVTLFKTVQSLATEGYLEVAGLEKTVKTYARKLKPALTKEEYYAKVLKDAGLTTDDLPALIAAIVSVKGEATKDNNKQVIQVLEDIIKSLK